MIIEHEPLTFDKTLNTMPLDCEIAVIGEDEDTRECIGDLEKAIGTDPSFGGLALNCELQSDEMNISHKENKIIVIKAILQIQYVNTVGSP